MLREIDTNFVPKDNNIPVHFGDFKNKINEQGRISKTSYPTPDFQLIQIDKELDFIFLANNNFFDMKN